MPLRNASKSSNVVVCSGFKEIHNAHIYIILKGQFTRSGEENAAFIRLTGRTGDVSQLFIFLSWSRRRRLASLWRSRPWPSSSRRSTARRPLPRPLGAASSSRCSPSSPARGNTAVTHTHSVTPQYLITWQEDVRCVRTAEPRSLAPPASSLPLPVWGRRAASSRSASRCAGTAPHHTCTHAHTHTVSEANESFPLQRLSEGARLHSHDQHSCSEEGLNQDFFRPALIKLETL